jgi:mannose-6-phosphate isomerase
MDSKLTIVDSKLKHKLFLLEPQYRERVWGGRTLKASDPPVGEAWIAFGESRVRGGEYAGRRIAELTSEYGAQLIGAEVAQRFGRRFPLLVKLLDCADWLSVQVHPNDEQAARLVGPGETGKVEAWHFLKVEPGASILAGVKQGTTPQELEKAIRGGNIFAVAERFEVRAGETILIDAGTLHALGPGLLLYEVQQSSDTTYRMYDWDRPADAGRSLHVEESIAVTDPRKTVSPVPLPNGATVASVVNCPFFELDVLRIDDSSLKGDTEGRTFHVLTASEGAVEISCDDESVKLNLYETVLVAASAGAYEINANGGTASAVLRASVPAC